MCRLLGWTGEPLSLAWPVLDAPRALRTQSRASREAAITRHEDGYGIAWYARAGAPSRLRDPGAAWRDRSLDRRLAGVRSPLAIAHVRAATEGDATEENTHPFVDGQLAFAHVGAIAGMDVIRARLRDALSPPRRCRLHGSTDSELLFAMLVDADLARRPAAAWASVLARIAEAQRAAGTERSIRLAAVHTDGRSLFAYRHATDGDPPTLYLTGGRGGIRAPDRRAAGTLIASEPVEGRRHRWRAVPRGRAWRVTPRGLAAA